MGNSDSIQRLLMKSGPASFPSTDFPISFHLRSRVNSTAVGIAVGFGILGLLFTIGIIQFCCKYKCKNCKKCCKKKEPSLKDKVLTKVGLQKSPPPFSISSIMK